MKSVRQRSALQRLESQLKSETKTKGHEENVPLTDKDIARIKSEITILKSRLRV